MSQRIQAGWLGGDAAHVPHRWAAASPAEHAHNVRTPVLLIYAESGNLAAQGHAWLTALTAAAVEHKLITVPGADHVFSANPDQQLLHQAVTDWFERHR